MSRVAARIAQTADSGINLIRLMTGLLHETWQSKISGVPFRMRYITDSTSKYGLVVVIRLYDANSEVWMAPPICGPNEPLYPRLKAAVGRRLKRDGQEAETTALCVPRDVPRERLAKRSFRPVGQC